MKIDIKYENDKAVAYLFGEIDHHSAKEIRSQLDSYIITAQPEIFAIDMGGISFMDSSGIGLIMGRYRLMKLIGGSLLVCNVPPHIKRIIDLSGVGTLGVLEYRTKEAMK